MVKPTRKFFIGDSHMDRVVSWQTYAVVLLAVVYGIMHTLGVGQVIAALLATAALSISIIMLFALRVPAILTALFTPLIIALLTVFASAASGSVALAVTVAGVFAVLVVGLAATFSLPLPNVKFHHALLSYAAQASIIISILLYWQT